MAANIANVKMGPCSVVFNDVDLGHSKGGCVVNYSPDWYDITVDKYGSSVAEKVLKGEMLTATVPLAESTIANMMVAMPALENGTTKATIGRKPGSRASDLGAELVLHPLANASDDLSEDVVFWIAISTNEVPIGFTVDGEKLLEVTFQALVDESKDDGNMLGMLGDSTT